MAVCTEHPCRFPGTASSKKGGSWENLDNLLHFQRVSFDISPQNDTDVLMVSFPRIQHLEVLLSGITLQKMMTVPLPTLRSLWATCAFRGPPQVAGYTGHHKCHAAVVYLQELGNDSGLRQRIPRQDCLAISPPAEIQDFNQQRSYALCPCDSKLFQHAHQSRTQRNQIQKRFSKTALCSKLFVFIFSVHKDDSS